MHFGVEKNYFHPDSELQKKLVFLHLQLSLERTIGFQAEEATTSFLSPFRDLRDEWVNAKLEAGSG